MMLNTEEFKEGIRLYLKGDSMKSIADALNVNQFTLRRLFVREGLAIKVRDRAVSYEAYQQRELNVSNTEDMGTDIGIISHKLDIAERALIRTRAELNYHRRTVRNDVKDEELSEKLLHIVKGVADTLDITTPEIKIEERSKALPEYGLVMVLSDLHIGDVVLRNDVPDNEFNYKIAQQRLDHFTQEVLNNPRQSKVLVITSLFDFIKGIIHGGVYETEGSLVESISKVVEMYTRILITMGAVYDRVEVYSTGSNHERVHEHVATTKKYLDFGRLIDMITQQILKASKVTNVLVTTTDTGYNLVTLNGANILLFHGDTLRTYKPTATTSRSKVQDVCNQMFGCSYRHCISGHTHEFVACTNQYNGLNIVSGSLVGNSSYGVQSGYAAIVPSQLIVFVERDGSIQTVHPTQF